MVDAQNNKYAFKYITQNHNNVNSYTMLTATQNDLTFSQRLANITTNWLKLLRVCYRREKENF